jgi:hypothetical protein
MSELTWDQVSAKETLNEGDVKNAENSGKPPVGKYLTVIESSKPKQVNPEGKDSYFVATLVHKIEEVIEIEGKPVSGGEGEQYIGRKMFDDVSLPKPDEADALKNRRILIAKRAGIISDSSAEIPKNTWGELILGKRFLVTTEENEYTPKGKTKPVSTVRIAMFGYDVPENAVAVSDADLDDI